MATLNRLTHGVKGSPTVPAIKPVAADPKAPKPKSASQRYYKREEELTVVTRPVDDEFRRFFWSLPQFAPWKAKLASRNRKDRLTQSALSLLLDFLVWGHPCSAHKGHRWDAARRIAALAEMPTGELGAKKLNERFAEVGLVLAYEEFSFPRRLTRSYRLDGRPEALTDYVRRRGTHPREFAARLDNVSADPCSTPARRAQKETQVSLRAMLDQNIAEVAKWNPARADRMAFYRDVTCAHREEVAARHLDLFQRAQALGCDESVFAAIHEAAALGLPRPQACSTSTSARIGGTLGRFPSKLQPHFVSGFVSLDLRAATPAAAAFLFGSRESQRFMTECFEADVSPTTRIASEVLAQCGVSVEAQLGPDRPVLDAAQKVAKHWWTVGLNGGGDFMWPSGALESRRQRVPGFYDALRRHPVVADTIRATWGDDGKGGVGGRIAYVGHYRSPRWSYETEHAPFATWKQRKKVAARALSDAYNAYEWTALRAALAAVQRSDAFSILGDSNDGFSVKRRDIWTGNLHLDEIDEACAAARRALREAGADGRLRVKYDAQRGGELEDESTLRWLRERVTAVAKERRAA